MYSALILSRPTEGHPPLQVGRALVASGYDICTAGLDLTGAQLLALFPERLPELIVSDLSDVFDLSVLHRLRGVMGDIWGEGIPLPPHLVLITRLHLSSPDLRLLIDDFLMPPYDPEELKARLGLVLFRRRYIELGDTLIFAGVRLHLTLGRATTLEGAPLDLTRREFDLLRFLMMHRGRGFTREQLLSHVWGMDYDGGERTIDIHIRRLRAKLPADAVERLETRRGYGYGFRVDGN